MADHILITRAISLWFKTLQHFRKNQLIKILWVRFNLRVNFESKLRTS